MIGGAAVCALPLHIFRLVQAEQSFARLRLTHDLTMEACAALRPGSLVVPVVNDPDPLLQHLEAYVAIAHDGILTAPDEHLGVIPSPKLARYAYWLWTEDPAWLVRQWRKGIPPEVDQVLFIGKGIDPAGEPHPWPSLLRNRFRLSFDNGHARIFTAVREQVP